MILRSIAVRGWRCFADPMTVGPFGDAINVIHAPTGASSTATASAAVKWSRSARGAATFPLR